MNLFTKKRFSHDSDEKKTACPFCQQWKVRTYFKIQNLKLYEKRICMNLECPYMEYSLLTADLEIKKRLCS